MSRTIEDELRQSRLELVRYAGRWGLEDINGNQVTLQVDKTAIRIFLDGWLRHSETLTSVSSDYQHG